MGSWDCYCAICGGPFGGANVSQKPRTARFHRICAKKTEKRRERGISDDADVSSGSEGEEDGDTESLDRYDEDHSYDPEVISAEDTKWTEMLHVLGFNPEAKGTNKTFVSGPGSYVDYGGVHVEQGSDLNADDIDIAAMSCYHSWNSDDPVFPFHWCCFELLAKCLTGSFDVDKLDKDLLYSIMRELSPEYGGNLEDIDYGAASSMQEQFWGNWPGYEFVVSHPRDVPAVDELVLSMFGSRMFEVLPLDPEIGKQIRSDPFSRLSYDLVYKISTMLEDGDLFNMAKASWPVHALLREISQFWRQRLKKSMPWFFELNELLERDRTLLQETDPKRICLWAEKITRPKKWMTGPLMGVANRRRIWSVCEQLGERYQSRLEPEDPAKSCVEEAILKYSKCPSLVTVSAPETVKADVARNVYWIKSWPEIHSNPKEVATFWEGDMLVGISIAPYDVTRGSLGREMRILGKDNLKEGVHREFKMLMEGNWITGLILHIPALNFGHCKRRQHRGVTAEEASGVTTSPRGLTVILNTGETMLFGTTKRGYSLRVLLAAPDWYITGITGMLGEVDGKQRLTRLGLLQAQHQQLTDYTMLPEPAIPPKPTPLQSLLWDESYKDVLDREIWNHANLRLIHELQHLGRPGDGVHRDLIPYEALIWARNERDLRSLRRLSSYVVVGGKVSSFCAGVMRVRDVHDVCGVHAEFAPESAFMRRMIGINKKSPGSDMTSGDPWMHFQVDGAGGEIVTEVQYAMHEKLKAMKLRTNRGRECYWGEVDAQNWQILKPPSGETLVGLVMAFAEPSGFDHEKKTYAHCKLSFVGALSMPLGIPEESQPVRV